MNLDLLSVIALTLAAARIVGIIAVALVFDYINGFHDAANSIATVVSTRVLTPMVAVFWAAFFNFIAFAFFGLHVAQTLGKGIVEAAVNDALGTYFEENPPVAKKIIGKAIDAAYTRNGPSALLIGHYTAWK